MAFIYSVIGFLIAIAVLVTIHEFGHYWVAKKLGVKILRFSVGFGKPLWKKVAGPDQTEYMLAAIPMGGYVKMLGEEDDEYSPEEAHRAFNNQKLWKRAAIVFAGPGINFLFAILVYFGLMMTGVTGLKPVVGDIPESSVMAQAGLRAGDEIVKLDGKAMNYFGEHRLHVFNKILKRDELELDVLRSGRSVNLTVDLKDVTVKSLSPSFLSQYIGLHGVRPKALPVVGRVVEDSPAMAAGLELDDRFLEVNGEPIDAWADFVKAIRANGATPLELTIQRDGKLLQKTLTPALVEREGVKIPQVGIGAKAEPIPEDYIIEHSYGVVDSAAKGANETWLMSLVTLRMFGKMLTMEASPKNISGPITIAQVAGDAIQVSLAYFLNILAVISISLGVINLLPIPMLDGGHLLYYAIEAVTGKPVSEKMQMIGQKIGLLFLAGLMSLAFYNDIFRLLS